MATNYTRLIEFKVKDTELNRAVGNLSKTLDKIDKTLVGIDKKLETIAKTRFKDIEKEAVKVEKSMLRIGKVYKKMLTPQGVARGAVSGVFGLLGLNKKAIAETAAKIGFLDAVVRRFTKNEYGLGKAIFETTGAIQKAVSALDRYGRSATDLIRTHSRLIDATGKLGLALGTVAAFTPQIFAAGKAWRQLEYDIRRVGKAYADSGLRGVGKLFPAGSMIGKRARGREAGDIDFDGQKAYKGLQKEWRKMGEHPGNIKAHIEGLTKVNKILGDNQKIQEGINAFTGRHVQAVIATRKAQTAVNHELLKAKATQLLFNADIWAAQRAWNGLLSTLQKAVGLIGKLSLGLVGKVTSTNIGKAAGIIGASRGIEDLIQKVPLLSQALKDNIQTFATWTRRVTEAVASVSIAYTGLSTALSAAKWVTGAVTGFINWEKQAAQSIWNVQRAFNRLDSRMASNLDQGKGLFAGLTNWLGGGDERKEQKRATLAGPSRPQRISSELAKQKALLEARNLSEKAYLEIKAKIIKLERIQTKEIAQRRRLAVKAGADPNKVFKAELDAVEKALEAQETLRDKAAKRAADIEDKRVQRRIKEDDKANQIAMAAKQKIWDAEGKAWEQRMRWADKERLAEKKYQEQLKRRKEARKQKMGRLGENLMLGAGFPLLFGGGAGAVGGGVLGAGLQAMSGSQGFGMQILFSALGQQLDAFMGKTAELGQAFSALDKDVTPLVERLGVAGTQFERQIKLLEKLGAEEQAFALAREEMLKLVGDKGVKDLTEFGKETQELGNAWGKLVTQMQAGLAGLINTSGILKALTQSINRSAVINQAYATGDKDPVIKGIINEMTDKRNRTGIYSRRRSSFSDARKGTFESIEDFNARKAQRKSFPQLTEELFQRQSTINKGNTPDLKGAVEKVTIDKILEEQKLIQMKIDFGDKEAAIEQKINEIMKENKDLDRDKVKAAVRAVAATEEEYEAVQRLNALYTEMGGVIRDGLVNAIESAVEGTKTLGEVASSVFRSIARMMLNYGITAGLGSIGIKTRASGGPVTGGKPYIVGEKGPELFTPGSSGKITPNHELGGGNVSVNVAVDASGSSAQGDQPSAQELGRLIGAAVQSELVRQKRPGGVLY